MLRRLIKGFRDIAYPKICLACKGRIDKSSVDGLVCLKCWGKIGRNTPPFCSSCGRHLDKKNFSKNICPECARKQKHFDRAFSPCAYTGVMRELIHQFKYKGKQHLGRPLSRLLIKHIKEYSLPMQFIDLILPMPLHSAKLRQREFNQAQVLSGFIAEAFDKRVDEGILCRSRLTRTQTELELHERHSNVKDSFCVNGRDAVCEKNILLIDDVLTSGATSSEAALHLKEAGANIVFVLTLAN